MTLDDTGELLNSEPKYLEFPYHAMPPTDPVYLPEEKMKYSAYYAPVRTTPKISRNSLCQCGSGLKTKKCCNP